MSKSTPSDFRCLPKHIGPVTCFWSAPRLFFFVFLCVTVLQRFAIPAADSKLGVGFVFSLGIAFFGVFSGLFYLSYQRFFLFTLTVCCILLTIIVKITDFSFLSLAMLLTLYLPYIFILRISSIEYNSSLLSFQAIIFFCAACGILQFLFQIPLGWNAMFPFDQILPVSFFTPSFNLRIPVNHELLRSTGLWFLEPSIFSQFLAFSLVIELTYFRRTHYLAMFAIAYALTFSGTGIVLLLAASIFHAMFRQRIGQFILILDYHRRSSVRTAGCAAFFNLCWAPRRVLERTWKRLHAIFRSLLVCPRCFGGKS